MAFFEAVPILRRCGEASGKGTQETGPRISFHSTHSNVGKILIRTASTIKTANPKPKQVQEVLGGNGADLKRAVSFSFHLLVVRHRDGGEIPEFLFVGLFLSAVPLGHDLVDLHEGFILGFGDYEIDVNDRGQADAAEDQEAVGPKPLLARKQTGGTGVREGESTGCFKKTQQP